MKDIHKQGKIQLLTEHLDPYGRVTLQPSKLNKHIPGDWESENQLLWTGEASVLLKRLDLLNDYDKEIFRRGIKSCENVPGLYHRHPGGEDADLVSLDEYNGLAFYCIASGDEKLANEILQYCLSHEWCVVSDDPNETNCFQEGYWGKWRRPKDRVLTRVAANSKPKWYELLLFYIGMLHTSLRKREETSGKVMDWVMMEALELAGFTRFTYRIVKKICLMNYEWNHGENYVDDIFAIYFNEDATKTHHPFRKLIK